MWCQNSGVFCFQGTRKIFKGWFYFFLHLES